MYTGASTNSERETGRTTVRIVLESTIRTTAITKTKCSALVLEN
jgi:hypothetical protein